MVIGALVCVCGEGHFIINLQLTIHVEAVAYFICSFERWVF